MINKKLDCENTIYTNVGNDPSCVQRGMTQMFALVTIHEDYPTKIFIKDMIDV